MRGGIGEAFDYSDSGSSTGSSFHTVLNLTYYLLYSLFYLALSGLYLASMGAGFLENIRNIAHLASDQWLNMITACALFAIGIYFLFFPIVDKVKSKGAFLDPARSSYVFAPSMSKSVDVSYADIRTRLGVRYVTTCEPF